MDIAMHDRGRQIIPSQYTQGFQASRRLAPFG